MKDVDSKIAAMKLILTTGENKKKCAGCDTVQHFWNIIDNLAMVDGKYYCRSCQNKMGIGWYEKKEK